MVWRAGHFARPRLRCLPFLVGIGMFIAPAGVSGGERNGGAASPVAGAENVGRWHAEMIEASTRFGVPLAWIERVMQAESRGRSTLNGRPITSPAGAMGLMQLMPATWAELRARLGLGSDPYAPRDNILAGTAYLRDMYERFGYPGMFAAYNAGPARYAASLATGRPLPGETRAYLAQVAGDQVPSLPQGPSGPGTVAARQSLFIALASMGEAGAKTGGAEEQSDGIKLRGPDAADPLFAVRAKP
jgi:hypothetical protein